MPPGRNAPCPCGSGRKYKTCCLQKDLKREADILDGQGDGELGSESLYARPEMRARLQASARSDRTWEVAAIPVPSAIESDPDCRPVAVMVATRDAVLAMDLLPTLPGETEAVASALHDILKEAMRLSGARPRFLDVPHHEVAVELASLLTDSGIEVAALGGFERTHGPARALVEDLSGEDFWPPMSRPETWSAWQLPEADVAALFRAAADFFKAAPWTVLADSDGLGFVPGDGPVWAGAVMGQGGEVFGLCLYEHPEDLMRLYEGDDGEHDAFGTLEALDGRIITLTFEEAHSLPRPMRREVARKGWEVASPSGYPTLMVLNTPGGGASRADVRFLAEALALVPRYLAAVEPSGAPGTPLPEWTSPETGTVVYPLVTAGPVRAPLLLQPGYARGRAARPGAFLAFQEGADDPGSAFEDAFHAAIELVHRFGTALHQEGMGEPTIMAHVRNAAEFVQFLVGVEGVPLTGLHERDLRSFLLDWHPRTFEGGRTRARRMPVSLTRFLEFLEWAVGLRCPWAWDVLEDRDYIRHRLETAPRGSLMDPEVVAWRYPVQEEVERRLLRPYLELVQELGIELDSHQGTNLIRELTRSWLLWREELIESGIRDEDELWDPLVERQREWMEEKGLL
jgi:hypothetical protein